MVFLVLCDFFGQIHSTSLNFNLQIGLWAKKHLVFVFVSILMTMSYMSLEIFSFEWIQILNGRKVWQYHRLSHHKIWATSIHIWFFEFHTNAYGSKKIDVSGDTSGIRMSGKMYYQCVSWSWTRHIKHVYFHSELFQLAFNTFFHYYGFRVLPLPARVLLTYYPFYHYLDM